MVYFCHFYHLRTYCSPYLQKEHEESLLNLKKQLSSQSESGAADDTLKVQLADALVEVSSLKQQLESSQSSLEALKKSQYASEMAVASAAGPDAIKILAEKQSVIDERDRAVTKLTSQTQAWNVEREQLKKEIADTKSSLESKLAAAGKVTPGGGADSELASKLEKLDSILKASIKTGDLRGVAVAEVGRVRIIFQLKFLLSYPLILKVCFRY